MNKCPLDPCLGSVCGLSDNCKDERKKDKMSNGMEKVLADLREKIDALDKQVESLAYDNLELKRVLAEKNASIVKLETRVQQLQEAIREQSVRHQGRESYSQGKILKLKTEIQHLKDQIK